MKKNCMTGSIIVFMLLVINSFQLKSQSEIVDFIAGGIGDGEKLIQAYLEPLGNGMGANLNGGWYNTAKVHRTLGFDINLTLTVSIVPETATTFDVNSLNLQNFQIKEEESSILPTFAGPEGRGSTLVFQSELFDNTNLVELEVPGGVDWLYYPMPMIKAGVGLPKGFELNVRFVPTLSFQDLSTNLWGFGVKYDVIQHFGLIDRFPFLNASVFGAYTRINFSSNVDFQKDIYNDSEVVISGGQDHYDNQSLDIRMQGFTTSAIVSLDLPVITFFGSLGFSRAYTTVSLLGDYPMLNYEGNTVVIEDFNNPVNFEFDNYSGLQATAGLRFKLAIFTLHANYTRANYNLITAGVGLSFR